MLLPTDVSGARASRYLAGLEPKSAVGYDKLPELYTDNYLKGKIYDLHEDNVLSWLIGGLLVCRCRVIY